MRQTLLLFGLILLGCGNRTTTFDSDAAIDDGSTTPPDDVVIIGTGDASDAGGGRKCGSDLQSVVDDQGNLVETCPNDKGCVGGVCVPACQAAEASKGSLGCKFVVSTPAFSPVSTQPCFAMFVANSWPKDAQITVKRGSQTFNVTSFGRIPNGTPTVSAWSAVPSSGLPANKVAVLFLSSSPTSNHPIGGSMACPVTPAVNSETVVAGTGRGTSFEITSDVPLTAYDMHPFGGARSFLPSAQLLLPTSAWGNNFVAMTAPNGNWGQIIASENGTSVDVVPTVALPSGTGVAAAPFNVKTTFTMNAGEYIHWGSGNMSGSVISSTKPLAYVGGTTSLCLSSATSSGGGCDSNHQLVPPVQALGSEYAVAPYGTRRKDMADESIIYRIAGTVDGTKLTYSPSIGAAPTTLDRGDVVQFETTGGFVVKSQDDKHPFYVGQAMTGCSVTSGSRPGVTQPIPFGLGNCLGDEEYVVVLPPAQFMSNYVFFTDSTYATTNLVLTRSKTSSGFKDVTIGCLGTVSGWKAIGTSGQYEQTNVDLVRENKGVGSCVNGGHTAKSDGPFGITVWGEDVYASYGYPAGGNVASINTVVVPPLPK